MSTEIRRLLEQAREATGTLRDAAREGRVIEFRQRDKLVSAIHRAFDELEAFMASQRPPTEAPTEIRRLLDKWRAEASRIDSFHATMAVGYKVCADELEALLGSQRPPTEERHVCGLQGYQRGGAYDDICPACQSRGEMDRGGTMAIGASEEHDAGDVHANRSTAAFDEDVVEIDEAGTVRALGPHSDWSLAAISTPAVPSPADPQPDYVELLKHAKAHVRSSPLWKRFIEHTPLENDIAVWMADFASAGHPPTEAQKVDA